MKLYYSPGSGSFVVEAVLAELGLDYERQAVDIRADQQFSPEFLAVNPRAQVPALVLDDGTALTESAAIALYLADTHGNGRLLPAHGTSQRGVVLRWLFFAASNLYEADLHLFYPERYTSDPACAPAVKQAAEQEFERCAGLFGDAIGAGPYLLGHEPSVADLYVAMLVEWHWDKPRFFAEHPKLGRLREAVAARAALVTLWEENFPG